MLTTDVRVGHLANVHADVNRGQIAPRRPGLPSKGLACASMKRAALLALYLAGCSRYGLALGTSRMSDSNDPNKSIMQVEAGRYAKSGVGGYVVFGGKPGGREDNDSVHNSDSPWLMGDVRYRRAFFDMSEKSRLYAAGAAGAGLCRNGVITEVQIELGAELRTDDKLSFDLSLRYGPVYIAGDDGVTYAVMLGVAAGRFQ